MNDLITHIEFLLHSHDCVIIPNFGGFVINSSPSIKDGFSSFIGPKCDIIFNRELTHNDGLLAQSYMKINSIRFEEANKQIQKAVSELTSLLESNDVVQLGELGAMRMNEERKYLFSPTNFIRPEFIGLTNVAFKPLIQVQPTTKLINNEPNRKKLVRKIGVSSAVAAAVIAVFILLTPFIQNVPTIQNANIVSESNLYRNNTSKDSKEVKAKITEANTLNAFTKESSKAVNASSNSKKYYIVVGVYEVRDVAEQTIISLKEKGFENTSSIKRSGRIDVYLESFEEQNAAEEFLKEVHSMHQTHRDAWILKY